MPTLMDLGIDEYYEEGISFDEMISREEINDTTINYRVKYKPPPSPNWDEEF